MNGRQVRRGGGGRMMEGKDGRKEWREGWRDVGRAAAGDENIMAG